LEFYGGTKPEEGPSPGTDIEIAPSDETPEELIASSHSTLRKLVQAELLTKIVAGSPEFFERLVVNL
jgi:restriction endonuclease Mrr